MTRIDDRKLYLYFILITALIALILGATAFYSLRIVEPRVKKLLAAKEGVSEQYRAAYLKLRKPQVFARYDNFDAASQPIKVILRDFDRRVYEKRDFGADDAIYLQVLLDRRMAGSRLTRNTSVFFLLLALIGCGFYIYERRQFAKE